MSRKLDGQAMQQWQDICTRLYNHAYNLHKASRHTKVRYARILESFLQQSNLNEPLVTKDWLKAALSLAPGMVSNSVSVVCACTSAQQYWPLAIQLLQIAMRLYQPGHTLLAELPQEDLQWCQIKLAQQCKKSYLLDFLSAAMEEATQLMAGSRCTLPAMITAGCSCSKLALQQQGAYTPEDLNRLQYGTAVLQLFHAVNSMWPGSAGLLATQEGQAAAGPAFSLSAVLLEQSAGVRVTDPGLEEEATELTQEAVAAAVTASSLLAKQLHCRLQFIATVGSITGREQGPDTSSADEARSLGQQLLNEPALMHMLLLLTDTQLQQYFSKQDVGSSCSSSKDSTPGPPQHLEPNQSIAAACCDSKTAAATAALQDYHTQVLQSFGGLPQQLYEHAAAAAACKSCCLDLAALLQLLVQAVEHLATRCKLKDSLTDVAFAAEHPRDFVSCAVIGSLIAVTSETAGSLWKEGEKDLAGTAVQAIVYASDCLHSAAIGCRHTVKHLEDESEIDQVLAFMYKETENEPGLMLQLCSMMQLVAGHTPAAVTGAVSSSSGSVPEHAGSGGGGSSSSASSLQLQPLTKLLVSAGKVHAAPFLRLNRGVQGSGCRMAVAEQHLVAVAAAVERSMRILAAHAATAGDIDWVETLTAVVDILKGNPCMVDISKEQHVLDVSTPNRFRGWQRPAVTADNADTADTARTAGTAVTADTANTATAADTQAAATAVTKPATARQQLEVVSLSVPYKVLFAVLVSTVKLAHAASACMDLSIGDDLWKQVLRVTWDILYEALRRAAPQSADSVAGSAAAHSTAAAPWLVILARCLTAQAQQLKRHISALLQPLAATASAANGSHVTTFCSVRYHIGCLSDVLDSLLITGRTLRLAPSCMLAEPAAAAALQQDLSVLWQQFEQQLLPQLQQANQLTGYVESNNDGSAEYAAVQLSGLRRIAAPGSAFSAAVEGLAAADTAVARGQAVASFAGELPEQLDALAHQLCALLPLPLCCNNPECGNVSMQSELQLVGGKACICAGCEVARYCGRECQAAHWQAHKKVCRIIKRSQAVKAAAA